jgi:lysophospholipase L1-like esterase
MTTIVSDNDIVLFQGDSITDCGRARDMEGTANQLGALSPGYAMMVASELLAARPAAGLQFYNRGISGNRIVDLYARIRADIINLRPNVISILIGVNDTWHGFGRNNGVDVPKYERVYRELLREVRAELPSVKFVLCEPFVLKCGVVADGWVEEIDQRRAVVAKLAQEFDAVLVPFQSMFDEAVKSAPPAYWAADGVHPTAAGHRLMAKAWLQSTGLSPA